MGRPAEALPAAEDAVAIYRDNYGDSWQDGRGALRNEHTAWAVFVRAELEATRGNLADAQRDHRQVLRFRRRIYGRVDHPHIAASLQALADIAAHDPPRRDEAMALHHQARAMRVTVFGGEDNYWIAQSDVRIAELVEDRDERLDRLRSAERVWGTQLAPHHPWLERVRLLTDEM
jgi:hypothetical protein